MPRKRNKTQDLRLVWLRQQRQQVNADNLQGGFVEEFEAGRPVIRLANGGRLRQATAKNLGGVGVGDQVNPTIGAVPRYDFLGSNPVEIIDDALLDLTGS